MVATEPPPVSQLCPKLARLLGSAAVDKPAQRGPKVVLFALEPVHRLDRVGPQDLAVRPLCESQKMSRVSPARVADVAVLHQTFGRILAQRLEVSVSGYAPVVLDHHQRLGNQMAKQIEDSVTIDAAPAADRLSWIQRPTSCKHRQSL